MPFNRYERYTLAGFTVAVVVFIADFVTKALILADDRLGGLACKAGTAPCGGYQPISWFPIMDFQMMWNYGVSFGMLQAHGFLQRLLLIAFALVMSTVLAIWLTRVRRPIIAVGLGLIIGGAIGNVVDRIRWGAVADFIDFSEIGFNFIFNIADAAISVGVAALFVDMILEHREEAKAARS